MTTLTFGKHKGTDIKNVPLEYLEWGSNKLESPKLKKQFKDEIKRRQDENTTKEKYILENIDSPEVWEMLLQETEAELWQQEINANAINCQYDSRAITQKEVNDLANEKLAKYKKKIELNQLDADFKHKWNLSEKQMDTLLSAIEINQRMFSTEEKYFSAVEYIEARNELLWQIMMP
ncbi:MAG: hypothetical protein RLZZ184_51 [Cyanobacteriota bacterium]|jgi:hypothetical protein